MTTLRQQTANLLNTQRRQLVIIDPNVEQWEILAAGVAANTEVHILDPDRDGIQQITEILEERKEKREERKENFHSSPLSSPLFPLSSFLFPRPTHPTPQGASIAPLHIISHGAPGTLYLGNGTLELNNLEQYRHELEKWEIAHLYIYGCLVAAGDAGTEFIEKLHEITGTHISASNTMTGNRDRGGDWQLQFSTNKTSLPLPFTREVMSTYPGLLLEPEYEWAKNMGGSNSDEGNSIAIDSSGNVYTTGKFKGTVDFDPGAGTFELTSAGNNDIFISKLNPDGSFAWAKSMGGSDLDEGKSIAIDSSGNIYTTGRFKGTVDFDPGAGTFEITAAGLEDTYISKLNADGSFAWAKNLGGQFFVRGNSIALDNSGNIYTTGTFEGRADFDPGAGTFEINPAGRYDSFISKLNPDGSFAWAKNLGKNNYAEGQSIAIDNSGNIYTTGQFADTVDFDPGPGSFPITPVGADDIFISKLNSDGTFAWAKRLGGSSSDLGKSIATDADGNVYTTGWFQDTVDFDPSSDTFELTAAGFNDIFISKLNPDGTFAWAKSMGASGNDKGNSITVDSSGNVYTTGVFSGTVDFDPGDGTFELTAAGGSDIFISKLNPDGTFAWAKKMGGTAANAEAQAIAIDSSDNLYATGKFFGTIDFDPGDGTAELTSAGSDDIFISKLQPGVAPTVTLTTDAASVVEDLFTVTATFSEAVTGFELADITVGNGTASNLIAVSATEYTFDVTPTVDGEVTVDIAATTVTDTAGNDNIAATQLTRTADVPDLSPPTINTSGTTNDSTPEITGTVQANSTVTVFQGGTEIGTTTADASGNWTFTLTTAIADGTYEFTATATNANGTTSLLSSAANLAIDTTAPTVNLSSDADTTVNGLFTVTATFSEVVTGFDLSDITVGNGTASNFQTVSGTEYTFDVTPTDDGAVTTDVAAGAATDSAGNNNTAAIDLNRTAAIPPTVTLSSDAGAIVENVFTVTATFSEAVTDFELADITVDNGTASNFTAVSATEYTFDVTPTSSGQVTVDVAASKVTDNAGNNNIAALQLARTYADPNLPPGVFAVGNDGQVNVEFLFDGGGYQGEMALFSLEGMENLQVGSSAYMREAARRALTGTQGHLVINDRTDAARFTDSRAEFGEFSKNSGAYRGIQDFAMTPGTKFAMMLVPAGTVGEVFTSVQWLSGARLPFFSTQITQSQMVDLTGNGDTFGWEDLSVNDNSDRNYNDVIFQIKGAIGTAPAVDNLINPSRDWRQSTVGQEILNYANTGQTTVPAPPIDRRAIWTAQGWAIDGYIAGAEAFFDANKNGVRDDNEPTATTDEQGRFDLDLSLTEFDTNGNGQLDPEEGHIVITGGIDTANGLPLETPLKATPDAAIVSHLTSLVADLIDLGLSPFEANDKVKQVLSLPADVDLTTLDPIAATDEQLVGGVESNLAMVQLQNFITQTAGLIDGASTLDKAQVTLSVVDLLAEDFNNRETLDLTSAEQLQPLIEAAARKAAETDPSLDLDRLLAVAAGAATVMAEANQAMAEAVANGEPGINEAIAIVQKVSLDGTTDDLEAVGSGELSIEEAIANNTGDALSDRISGNPDVSNSLPVAPAPVSSFAGFGDFLLSNPSSSSETNIDNSASIPDEPTVDLANISLTAAGTDEMDIIDGQSTNDVITAHDGNDVVRGLGGNDILFGHNGDDELKGNQGADILNGNQGNDTIYSGQGNDIAFGGKDNDLIYGDLGSDTLSGDMGDDSLFGGTSSPENMSLDSADLLFGKDGNDYLQGNIGNDSISGGTGNDTAHGGQGNDLIHGDEGADILYGDKGNDSLTGNADDDVIYGGDGNDFLWGEDGDDFLYGEAGNDTLIGGNGKDYFAIQSGFGSDEVLDFIDGTDLIGLAGGLTFADLSITGSNGNTLISSNNELLATLTGVDVGLINSADFTVLV